MNLRIEKENEILEYKPKFFSLFTNKIIVWIWDWEFILPLAKEDKVYKNWNRLYTYRRDYQKTLIAK